MSVASQVLHRYPNLDIAQIFKPECYIDAHTSIYSQITHYTKIKVLLSWAFASKISLSQ